MPLAMRPHLCKLLFELRNLATNLTAIYLKLCLTWSPQANATSTTARAPATSLPSQVRPLTGQSRKTVFILRQLDLNGPLTGLCVLRENIED